MNLPLFWVGAPIAALVSRRHPLIGLSYYSIIFINGLSHVGALLRVGYNPGAFTALVLFLPVSIWVAWVCFGKNGFPLWALGLLIVDGILSHLILIGSLVLFLHGVIASFVLTITQILNGVCFFAIIWKVEKWLGADHKSS